MPPDGPSITGVTGGSAGLAATYDAVRALADAYDAVGSLLRGWAGLGTLTMANPDLAESALLSPITFVEAECAVLAATTGPDGVLVESVGWEADAVLVRTALAGLEAADLAAGAAVDAVDQAVGRAVGFTLGAAAPAVAPVLATTVPHLPPGSLAGLEDWVVEHPGLVEHAVNGGGGLLEGLGAGLGVPVLAPDTEAGAALLATAYGPDGRPGVHPVPAPGGVTQPADLAGLLSHLQDVAHLSPDPDSRLNGTVEVQTIGAGTDAVRHIVYLPGTDDMTTLPWTQDGDVRDFATDLLLLGGKDNAYQQGILEAMAQAGVGHEDPVLLVGHSMGGMEAVAILGQGSDYNVTNVVTAGSPTAHVDGFPTGSHVLSLEHEGDVVPLLDGEPNPDSVEQVTVTFDNDGDGDGDGVLDHHEHSHYVAGAGEVDASTDPSVREQLESLHAQGFLAAGTVPAASVTTQVFQIVREP